MIQLFSILFIMNLCKFYFDRICPVSDKDKGFFQQIPFILCNATQTQHYILGIKGSYCWILVQYLALKNVLVSNTQQGHFWNISSILVANNKKNRQLMNKTAALKCKICRLDAEKEISIAPLLLLLFVLSQSQMPFCCLRFFSSHVFSVV